jgi:NDP-sugar pyrophosphorylase family protein
MTGVGQRFVEAGYSDLKPLIETGIGSMIESVLKNHSSIASPICIISKDHPQKNVLRKEILRIRNSAKIFEIGGHKKGPSFSVFEVEAELDRYKPSVINYCDFSGVWSEAKLIEEIPNQNGLILTYTGFHPHMLRSSKFAYVKKDSNGRVIDIREKMPFTDNPNLEEASSGTYVFRETAEMIEAIRIQIAEDISLNGEFYTSLTYKPLIEARKNIKTFEIERFFQWGTPEDLRDFQVWSYAKLDSNSWINTDRKLNSTTIVLAAGGGTRLKSASNKPKPLLQIFDKELWNYAAEVGAVTSERLVITRSELVKDMTERNPYEYSIKGFSIETRSQVESAKLALREVKNRDNFVHILACDNIIPRIDLNQIEKRLEQCHMVVWLTDSYLGALGQEEQFSWIETDADGHIEKVHIKSNPKAKGAKLIIGNFSFKDSHLAINLIDSLDSRSRSVNDDAKENHLELVIGEALNKGLVVGSAPLPWFAAVGTKYEFRIAEYFESALSEVELSHGL